MYHPWITGSTGLVTMQGLETVGFSHGNLHWWATMKRAGEGAMQRLSWEGNGYVGVGLILIGRHCNEMYRPDSGYKNYNILLASLTFLSFSTLIIHERRQTSVPGAHLAHCQDPKYPRSSGKSYMAAPVNQMKYRLDLIRKFNVFAYNWCTQNIALSCRGIFMIYGHQM